MIDAETRERYEELRDKAAAEGLTPAEQEELEALSQALCREEDQALEEAAQRMREEAKGLEAELHRVQRQNQQLEALLREQEAYLAEVNRLLTQLETRRREWHRRYHQITGKPRAERAEMGVLPG